MPPSDVVVREGAAVLELLAREDETLLVRGDACERRERGDHHLVVASIDVSGTYFCPGL